MFNRVLSDGSIANQVAHLINSSNRLNKYYSTQEVLAQSNSYIVETLGSIVIGSVQVEKQAYMLSEIKHLVVHPKMRRQGLAKTLITAALNKSKTPMVYATIRRDNTGSRKAFEACGFINVGYYTTGSRDILMYVATCSKWKKRVDKTISNSYNDGHQRR